MGEGLVKCPRSTAPYTLENILEVLPSSSLNGIITGTSLSYTVSAPDSNFSPFMCSSRNKNSTSGLDDAILDQN